MSELPDGWEVARLPDICELNPGKPAASRMTLDTQVTFVPMAAVDAGLGRITNPTVRPYAEVSKGFTAFQENDVILAKITPCMENGKAAIARGLSNGIGFGSTEFHVFRHSNAILPEYLFYFIRQDSFRKSAEANMTGSVGQKRVPIDFLSDTILPLPPLQEQRRILAKLEKLLSRVDAAQARLATIPRILKRFRQSVLVAACSGRLTEDWRVEHPGAEPYTPPTLPSADVGLRDENYPNNWRVTRLGTLTALVTSGSRGWAKYYSDSGSIFIRAQNINADILNLEDIAFVTLPGGAEGLRTRVRQGDLLVTITGANVTKSALVERPIGEAFVSQHVALVRLADLRLSKFLFYSIINPSDGRKQLQTAAYGQGKPGLNLDNIRDVVVAIPPLAEQQEIVRRVEALFKTADALEARYRKAKAHVDKLTQSILAKAFRGELVPQDPNDEPASILLERIRKVRGLGDEKSEP